MEGAACGHQAEVLLGDVGVLGPPDQPADAANAPIERVLPGHRDHLGFEVDRPELLDRVRKREAHLPGAAGQIDEGTDVIEIDRAPDSVQQHRGVPGAETRVALSGSPEQLRRALGDQRMCVALGLRRTSHLPSVPRWPCVRDAPGSDSVWVTYVRERIAALKARRSHEVFDRETVDGAA